VIDDAPVVAAVGGDTPMATTDEYETKELIIDSLRPSVTDTCIKILPADGVLEITQDSATHIDATDDDPPTRDVSEYPNDPNESPII
jgi:hypothetical protein